MSDSLAEILDDLFHSAAFAAFIEQAGIQQSWPSLVETRERAYRIFEAALAVKNGRPETQSASR